MPKGKREDISETTETTEFHPDVHDEPSMYTRTGREPFSPSCNARQSMHTNLGFVPHLQAIIRIRTVIRTTPLRVWLLVGHLLREVLSCVAETRVEPDLFEEEMEARGIHTQYQTSRLHRQKK